MKEKVVILGGGESGVGAAMLAKVKGFDVFLSDNSLISSKHKQTLLEHDIAFEEGQHDTDSILSAKPEPSHLKAQPEHLSWIFAS